MVEDDVERDTCRSKSERGKKRRLQHQVYVRRHNADPVSIFGCALSGTMGYGWSLCLNIVMVLLVQFLLL